MFLVTYWYVQCFLLTIGTYNDSVLTLVILLQVKHTQLVVLVLVISVETTAIGTASVTSVI